MQEERWRTNKRLVKNLYLVKVVGTSVEKGTKSMRRFNRNLYFTTSLLKNLVFIGPVNIYIKSENKTKIHIVDTGSVNRTQVDRNPGQP